MTYMMKPVQKNFSLPPALADKWDQFQGVGSKESSRNASGALFLFMLMPAYLRDLCRSAAYEADLAAAMHNFRSRCDLARREEHLTSIVIDAARANEIGFGKKKVGKSAKSG